MPLFNPTTVADGSITSAKIADGAIVDADVNASAAIAQTKVANLVSDLSARVGSPNSTVTGLAWYADVGSLPGTGTTGVIYFVDAGA